jgi:hypothetical protein
MAPFRLPELGQGPERHLTVEPVRRGTYLKCESCRYRILWPLDYRYRCEAEGCQYQPKG